MRAASKDYPRIRTVGLDGILVTFGAELDEAANNAAIAFRAKVDELAWPEVSESASTLVSAYFRIDLAAHEPEPLMARLEDVLHDEGWKKAGATGARTCWTIPAVFGGARAPQLREAAELAGVSEAQARKELAAAELRVLTLGFAPGTPYTGYLPPNWDIPRQTALSTQVPVGALIVAVRQVILFSKTSPTGWRHIGQTAFRGFQPHDETPVLLKPGDVLRFTEVSPEDLAQIEARQDPMGGAKRQTIP